MRAYISPAAEHFILPAIRHTNVRFHQQILTKEKKHLTQQ